MVTICQLVSRKRKGEIELVILIPTTPLDVKGEGLPTKFIIS